MANAQAVQVMPSMTTLDSIQPGLSAQVWLNSDHCAGSSSKYMASSAGNGVRTRAFGRVGAEGGVPGGDALAREALCMVPDSLACDGTQLFDVDQVVPSRTAYSQACPN